MFNASKIRLKLPEVRYCGHIFSAQGIRADPEKVKAITNLSEPKDMKALQRFLGTVNYLAHFLPRLSQVCEPLRRLLAKDVEWSWQTQQQAAFDQIKQLVAKHPVLSYYDVFKPVTVQCDASDVGQGRSCTSAGEYSSGLCIQGLIVSRTSIRTNRNGVFGNRVRMRTL